MDLRKLDLSGRNNFVKNQLPAILWAGLIFTVSSIPSVPTPPLGWWSADKLAHFFEFGIFGFLLARALASWPRIRGLGSAVFFAASVGILWGLLDEVHQMFIIGRNASIYDFFADASGVIAAQATFIWIVHHQEKKL